MKSTRVNIRMVPAEKQQWEEIAAKHGMTVSEFVIRSVRTTIRDLASNYTTTITQNEPYLVWHNATATSGTAGVTFTQTSGNADES